ncbi:MAG: cell division protein ZapD [Gammaproteobacteria bacterium]|nr:cell division protein ZapD [Gammaproteobacteria bacterium]
MKNAASNIPEDSPVAESPQTAQHKIIYEQPLNERIRAFLRLEALFQQVRYHLSGNNAWDSRAALSGFLEILDIFTRSDLKTEVMKELDRHTVNLARLEKNPQVDRQQLALILDEMDTLIDQLHNLGGQLIAPLKDHELINNIQQRNSIPGGSCDFDLPTYHFWLQQPAEKRLHDIASWLSHFDAIAQSIKLILRLTRDSNLFTSELAKKGFWQKNLDANSPCQMVRVALPTDSPFFAEISGGRHRFSVRFLQQISPQERPCKADQDISFEISCCII